MDDRFDLQRFVDAQDGGGIAAAQRELRTGRKTSHWMWWVFPQLAGLGSSPTSKRYALSGLAEAQAYLAHPVLGDRLRECARILLDLPTDDPAEVLGEVDALKLKSSLTLFTDTDPDEPLFSAVLEKLYGGERDGATEELLG